MNAKTRRGDSERTRKEPHVLGALTCAFIVGGRVERLSRRRLRRLPRRRLHPVPVSLVGECSIPVV
jgi:hypothetical protein